MFKFPDHSASLEVEELKSEYTRSLLLICFFSTILVVAFLNYIFLERNLSEYYGGFKTFSKIIGFIIFFIIFQLANIRFLKKRMISAQRTSLRYKITHTIIEISIPSFIMVFIMGDLKMLSFIDTPVMLIYFPLITLSILHLDYRVNIFAGLLSALLYAGVVYYAFEKVDLISNAKAVVPANSYYLRCLLLALSGGAAAFVSAELKKRIKSALKFQEEKDKVEFLFGQQVSREVSRAIIEDKGATKRREATIMFVDIRNFTNFADTHSAEEVNEYQNKCLGPLIDIINLHQGVVFQILGDGLMACFGSPVENSLHADMAFQAGINILRQLENASNEHLIPATRIGIGLHSGWVVTGNIGNEQRKQFSISGTPVIVASRIEQLNKKYGTEFLISRQVYDQISPGKTCIEYLGEEPLRGMEKPIDVFKVSINKLA
ncbi:MAG TPA: adenylate/guanylate cyclase domain-containing protein [Chryseolinea sp.]|nr:adenylate/guanylate cyclase domain-containing protein [Chryseolinea sp.]